MSDLQAIADRVEIEALRGAFTDAVMMGDHDRTGDGWKFTERVYQVRFLDTTPLPGSAPARRPGHGYGQSPDLP